MKDLQQNSLKKNIGIYSLLFIIAAAGCYAFFILNGKTFVKYSASNADGLTQTYTAYVALKHMLQNALNGGGWDSWNWSLGLGGDTFEYYGFKLFNPLTYFIIAFPDNLIDVGYSIANVIRQYLAGLTFLLCMREVKLPAKACVTGAISYAFCGWMVEVVFNQGSFENAAIIFPLIVLGTEKIFKKKSPALFIVAVALAIASGVVWTYITGILTVAYYFARYHDYHKDESPLDIIKNTAQFFLYGITGVLISSPFILSILCSMGGATTDTGATTRVWAFSLKKYLTLPLGLFKYAEVGATSYSYICVSAVCICLLPLLIIQMKRRSTPAWIAVVLSLLSLIPLTSKIFNAMSYAAGRWYYGLMFFVIWATMECLNEEMLSSKKNLAIMTGWTLFLGAWAVALYIIDLASAGALLLVGAGICCCLAIIVLAYVYYVAQITNAAVTFVAAAVLIASIVCPSAARTYPRISDYLDKYLEVGESAYKVSTTPERVVPEIDDDSFYRSDQAYRVNKNMRTKLKTNSNIVYGNNSIYTYSSLIDSKWSLFNKYVGNNAGYYSRTNIISNDNRAYLDYLFGVKYFLGSNKYEKTASDYAGYDYDESETIDGVEVLENEHCIGLGTTFSKYISESEWMEYPALVRDQILLQAAVVSDETAEKLDALTQVGASEELDADTQATSTEKSAGLTHATAADLTTNIEEVDATVTAGKNTTIDAAAKTVTVSGGKGSIVLDVPEQENVQLVVALEGLEKQELSYDEAAEIGSLDAAVPDSAIGRWVEQVSYRDDATFKIVTTFGDIEKYCYCEKNSPRGFNDVESYNVNLGYGETIGGEVTMTFTTPGIYTYDAIKVYAIPMDVLDENAEKLEAKSYQITSYDGDEVEGTVTADEAGILFLSIPYDKGWKAYVDGEQVDTISDVDIAFTGIQLTAGEHEVVLKYSHWGMTAALAGTAVGLIGLAAIVYLSARRKNQHK